MAADGVIAIVIGRAGSKGLPGKNARLLAGRPMIRYAVDDAMNAACVTRTIVSTDGVEIARAARDAGVPVVDRPPALATDTATVADAVRHAVEAVHAVEPIVVVLYANVPIRPPGLIDEAVAMLRSTGADSVQSYADVGKHHPYWMVRLDPAHRVSAFRPNTIDRRQELPEVLIPDGGVIAVTRTSLLTVDSSNPHAFLGEDRRGVRTRAGDVIDVDTAADLRLAECVLADRSVEPVS